MNINIFIKYMTSLQLKKNDQTTVIKLAKDFINHYYSSLNNRNLDNILRLLKQFSIFSFENNRYCGKNIIEFLNRLFKEKKIQYKVINFDTIHSGARRINILVTGKVAFINNSNKEIKNFVEYIHMGQANDKQFWIQTSMFKIIQ